MKEKRLPDIATSRDDKDDDDNLVFSRIDLDRTREVVRYASRRIFGKRRGESGASSMMAVTRAAAREIEF